MRQISKILLLLTVFSVFAYSQKTDKEDYSQKIKEFTPKPLPQTPVVKRRTTDAQDENLKGKIKNVTRENEDLSGNWKTQGRKLSKVTDYDENGNRIKYLLYNSNAIPLEISVYGYIDGKRVTDSEIITLPGSTLITVINPTNEQETRKRDPRYSYSFEYKYTDGKLTEEKMIHNDGSLWMRYVYNYKANQVEELIYSEDGKLNQKYLSTLDDKGNQIERYDFDAFRNPDEVKRKYLIKYDSFDQKGNWTQRTTSEVVVENGKEVSRPIYIDYQTITYYP